MVIVLVFYMYFFSNTPPQDQLWNNWSCLAYFPLAISLRLFLGFGYFQPSLGLPS